MENLEIEMRDYISHRLYWKTINQTCELVELNDQAQLIAEKVAQQCLLVRQTEGIISRDKCWEILDNEIAPH